MLRPFWGSTFGQNWASFYSNIWSHSLLLTSLLQMLLWNAIGGVCIIAWNLCITFAVCFTLKWINLFRVKESDELRGLDFASYSNEPAYPGIVE